VSGGVQTTTVVALQAGEYLECYVHSTEARSLAGFAPWANYMSVAQL
jgi:hypothetical protein